jgi:serine/threonine-protein kinase HipA
MIKSSTGWVLAPAYDLLNVSIILPEDTDEIALTLEGKRKKLKKEHFLNLGKGLDLTDRQIDIAFNRMIKNKSKAVELIDKSFLSDKMKIAYKEILESRYTRLSLT